MNSFGTDPRDLRPRLEADAPLRRDRSTEESAAAGPSYLKTKRQVATSPENSAAKASRVFFFVIAAIIALAIAVFLILHPQAGD